MEHYMYIKYIKRKTLSWKVTNKNRKEDAWDIFFVIPLYTSQHLKPPGWDSPGNLQTFYGIIAQTNLSIQ